MQIDANAAVFYMQISHVNPPNLLFFGLVMPFHQFVWVCGGKKMPTYIRLDAFSTSSFVRIFLPLKPKNSLIPFHTKKAKK